MDISARIRKARESQIEAGGFTFTIRRPTDEEAVRRQGESAFDFARDFVVGWKGVKESDLVNGGGSDEVPFDTTAWSEWLADRPDLWGPIGEAVLNAYMAHVKRREDAAGN